MRTRVLIGVLLAIAVLSAAEANPLLLWQHFGFEDTVKRVDYLESGDSIEFEAHGRTAWRRTAAGFESLYLYTPDDRSIIETVTHSESDFFALDTIEFDEQYRLIKRSAVLPDAGVWVVTFEYAPDGSHRIRRDSQGVVHELLDEAGRVRESHRLSSSGDRISHSTFVRDDRGQVIERLDFEGESIVTGVRIEYEYDEAGHWITRTQYAWIEFHQRFEREGTVERRTISYY